MRPHMRHIQQTLVRKKMAEDAANVPTRYRRYRTLVERCQSDGYSLQRIIDELEAEAERIRTDDKDGDAIFKQGVQNAKASCLNAITLIISELKGEST